MKENHVKTISRGKGLRYDLLRLLGPFNFMPNCALGPFKCEMKFSLKHFAMGYVKMHGFHGNPLYDSQEWGVGLKINHI